MLGLVLWGSVARECVRVPAGKGPHHIVGACVRSLMPAAVWSGPEEDESGCGGSGPGGHGCGAKTKATEQAAAPAVLHGEGSDA